jgi:hypothetical protein
MSETVLVLCDDLLFWSKIQGAARAAGVPVVRASALSPAPAEIRRVLVDLQATSVDPFTLPETWKDGPELVAFASHVDLAAQERARRAGYHRVLARSAFVRELPELLTRPREGPGPPPSSPA